MKKIDMPPPARLSGNTYTHALSAVLAHLGTDITYDRIMGLTGVAFVLQVDTSGPFVDGEIDCAWWPNDAWGFDLGLPVLPKAVGWRIRKLRSNKEAFEADPAAEYRRVFAPAMEESLAAGRPPLPEHDHAFIVTAVDGGEPPLLGYGTHGKSTEFEDVLRVSCHSWGLILFAEKSTPADAAEVDPASLQYIIALYNEEAQGAAAPPTRLSGRQAWAEWLRLLGTDEGCDNNRLIHLRYNRGSALAYVRDMAGRHTGETAEHLLAAADLYTQSLDTLIKEALPYPSLAKGGEEARPARGAHTTMVEGVSRLEARAIRELEVVAAALTEEGTQGGGPNRSIALPCHTARTPSERKMMIVAI